MYLLFVIIISILLGTSFFLYIQNNKIKKEHLQKMATLHQFIESLHQTNALLHHKISITTIQDENYQINAKKIAEEIVQLQKIFVEMISNKNND